jgi:hypothetical protein
MNDAHRIRRGLRLLLGDCCAGCGTRRALEVHHVDGCSWVQRKLNSTDRWRRYLREFKQGVRLQLRCRACNASLNQWTYGTRALRVVQGGAR